MRYLVGPSSFQVDIHSLQIYKLFGLDNKLFYYVDGVGVIIVPQFSRYLILKVEVSIERLE